MTVEQVARELVEAALARMPPKFGVLVIVVDFEGEALAARSARIGDTGGFLRRLARADLAFDREETH